MNPISLMFLYIFLPLSVVGLGLLANPHYWQIRRLAKSGIAEIDRMDEQSGN